MNPQALEPGAVIAVTCGNALWPYTHYALVTAARDAFGRPVLVDNSRARGRVALRGWDEVAGGRHWRLADLGDATDGAATDRDRAPARPSVQQVLERARAMLGRRYNLAAFNCEHFVRLCHGLPARSAQVDQAVDVALAVGLGVLGVGLAYAARPSRRRSA